MQTFDASIPLILLGFDIGGAKELGVIYFPTNGGAKEPRNLPNHRVVLTLMTSSVKWWCSETGQAFLVGDTYDFLSFSITSEKALFLEGFWKTEIYMFSILHIYSFFVCKILTPVWSRSYASELNKARNWQNIADPTCVECSKNAFTVSWHPTTTTFVCHVPHISRKQSLHETLGNPVVLRHLRSKKNAEAKIAMEITSLFPQGLHMQEVDVRLIFFIAAGRVEWNTPERASKSHIGQIWVYELAVMYISYTMLLETSGRQNWYSSG